MRSLVLFIWLCAPVWAAIGKRIDLPIWPNRVALFMGITIIALMGCRYCDLFGRIRFLVAGQILIVLSSLALWGGWMWPPSSAILVLIVGFLWIIGLWSIASCSTRRSKESW